uniref:Shugoshin C-terminal domain-containing protein n=1 Tax=Anopheles epiroticus TaxID=199890 RepID=A0A182PL87_9DIPT
MEQIADPAKLLTAYKIINQQIAHENQKKRMEIKLHEERYNATNELLLRERQENKTMRDMVRKLKDQVQLITKVIVSVQQQTEQVFEKINRPHELAERLLQEYTPQAHRVYERRRMENPPYVDEDSIPEENEPGDDVEGKEHGVEEEQGELGNVVDETRTKDECRESDGGEDESGNADKTNISNRSRECRSSGAMVPVAASPLVQRLKRASKNASFDESFETIDRERAFKLSRPSQDSRRRIYANVEDVMGDLESVGGAIQMETEEHLSETLRNLSPVTMDVDQDEDENDVQRSHQSAARKDATKSQQTLSISSMAINASSLHPKQVTSEEKHLTTVVDDHSRDSSMNSHPGECEMTAAFNPTVLVASCSTPIAKGPAASENEQNHDTEKPVGRTARGRPRGRPRGRVQQHASKESRESNLNRSKINPIVVLKPLTQENVQAYERQQPKRRAKPTATMKEIDDSSIANDGNSDNGDGTTMAGALEPSSSTENLSIVSSDSNRPRRRAAPKSFREPMLNTKLRR